MAKKRKTKRTRQEAYDPVTTAQAAIRRVQRNQIVEGLKDGKSLRGTRIPDRKKEQNRTACRKKVPKEY